MVEGNSDFSSVDSVCNARGDSSLEIGPETYASSLSRSTRDTDDPMNEVCKHKKHAIKTSTDVYGITNPVSRKHPEYRVFV